MSSGKKYPVGRGRPPVHTQFPPGTSGNPNGRPPKPKRALVPSQIRKDVLEVMDELVEIKTAQGRKKITMSQLVFRTLAKNAAQGNPTALRIWMKLQREALQERFETYPSVRLIEMLMQIVDDPRVKADEMDKETLKELLRRTKRLY